MIPVTLMEPWRSDFIPMMSHHIITALLVASSYSLNHLRIGTAVFTNMDIADIFLPLGMYISV